MWYWHSFHKLKCEPISDVESLFIALIRDLKQGELVDRKDDQSKEKINHSRMEIARWEAY